MTCHTSRLSTAIINCMAALMAVVRSGSKDSRIAEGMLQVSNKQ